MFIYANVNMYNHHWITFLKVITVLGATGDPATLITAVFLIVIGIVRSMEGKDDVKETKTKMASAVKEDLLVHPEIPPEVAIGTITATTRVEDSHRRNLHIGMLGGEPRTEEERETILVELAEISEEIKTKDRLMWLGRLFSIFHGVFGIAVSIVVIERTIAINEIDLSASPVYSSSQLSALLVGIFTALPAAWKSILKLIIERSEFKDKVISAYRQQQFERREQNMIRIEKERIRENERRERERLQAENIVNPTENQPVVTSQSPWATPLATFATRMPSWRRSAQVNPESRAEQGVDVTTLYSQDGRHES